VVHDALPAHEDLGDEGAANHTRLAAEPGAPGLHLFVYGRGGADEPRPVRHTARQTRAASQAVARLHGLDPSRVVLAQQTPAVIDAGVFHNDVIAVGTDQVLLYHEDAFVDRARLMAQLAESVPGFVPVCVSRTEVSVDEAVTTYLFNSQLVRHPAGGLLFVGPIECAESSSVADCLARIVADEANPIREVRTLNLRQSMRNGGGPACLRLRVVLTDDEVDAVRSGVWLTPNRYDALRVLIEQRWRDQLVVDDLRDPALLVETREALDTLTGVLELGDDFYPFQRTGAA
jgi:succinylarginine dihydrolase